MVEVLTSSSRQPGEQGVKQRRHLFKARCWRSQGSTFNSDSGPGTAVLTGESSSGRLSFQVNLSESGSGGASSGGQVSACAGEERQSFRFSKSFFLSILLQRPYHH